MLETIIKNWDIVSAILFMAVFIITLVIWQRDGRTSFDLKDIIVDSETNKVSVYKFGQLIAMCVSTWVLVNETRAGRLTEFLFTTYMVTWSGTNLIKRFIDSKNSAPAQAPVEATVVVVK
jgi:hypothetical protein